MPNTALKYRAIREKRRNDPEIREKIARVLDTCDEALEEASELLQAAAAVLSKYGICEDDLYLCHLKDIQKFSDELSGMVAYRKSLDKERCISRLAAGRLGAEIDYLGDTFEP
jgi:hypothetical protein